MGYTHYWSRRVQEINPATWQKILSDCGKLILPLRMAGVPLADGDGRGSPTFGAELIRFNGIEDCGHAKRQGVSIPWPSDDAGGTSPGTEQDAGNWAFGTLLSKRTCDGDCSYETFAIHRKVSAKEWVDRLTGPVSYIDLNGGVVRGDPKLTGTVFGFCKTAFRPYDLAVQAVLLVVNHYLGEDFLIQSDGENRHWRDAAILCANVLGYDTAKSLLHESTQGTDGPTEDHTAELVNTRPGHFKFYKMRQINRTVSIAYGRIGTAGQLIVKTFLSIDEAADFMREQYQKKLRRGYQSGSEAQAWAAAQEVFSPPFPTEPARLFRERTRRGISIADLREAAARQLGKSLDTLTAGDLIATEHQLLGDAAGGNPQQNTRELIP